MNMECLLRTASLCGFLQPTCSFLFGFVCDTLATLTPFGFASGKLPSQ